MGHDVVKAYQQALADRDFNRARAMLTDDLRFEGPFETLESADDYAAAIQKLWGIVETIQTRHMSASGDEVVVLYDMVTRTPAGTQLICEWYGVEDGMIAWIRAVFDSAPFASLRPHG